MFFPYNILDYEIKNFCSNLCSIFTQLENKNIKHFKIKNKNISKFQTITIRKQNFNQSGFYSIKMDNFGINIDNIIADCKLTFNKKNKTYILHCTFLFFIKKRKVFAYPSSLEEGEAPRYSECKFNNNGKHKVASIDPGEKIFATIFGINHVCKIGADIRIKILQYETKIRKLQRKINKCNTNKNKNKLKKVLNKNYQKIKNIVKELHNKTAIFLCKNYERILLPKFETKKMIKNDIFIAKNGEELKILKRKKRLSGRVKFEKIKILRFLIFENFQKNKININFILFQIRTPTIISL